MPASAVQIQRAPGGAPVHYERRRPEKTALYRVVQEHVETFFAHVQEATGADLPQFVKDEFDAFLECGILAHGFLRLRCADCGHDKLVAFSCKGRGFCPSCGARRMAQTAANLVDHIIPSVPVRQWVLALPIPLRLLLASRPELLTPVLEVVQRVLTRFLLDRCGVKPQQAQGGAVTLIQRFGSAANLNIHLHCLVLDGVYRCDDAGPVFIEAPPPTDADVQAVLDKIVRRVLKMLTRRGALVQEQDSIYVADAESESDDARALRPLQAASCVYRIAFGPRAGQKVVKLQGGMPQEQEFERALCADMQGFSLHAAVRCEGDDRQGLERLCGYITRPALAYERVQCDAAGRVVLKLKTPWRDGTTHLVMTPLEFMQRLAALVPRPRLHLIRFHGVLAPNAKLRAQVVPPEPPDEAGACLHSGAVEPEPDDRHGWSSRICWALLLKRVFELDMQRCPNCGGELKVIAAILETAVIERILEHLGLPARPPPRSPARAAMPHAA